MERLLKAVDFLSGEWMLKNRSNGGALIFLRSALVSTLIFAAGVSIKCAVDPTSGSDLSFFQFRLEIRDHLGWLGATFAATYAGFYARYASQWSYLASLYNQIMATASGLTDEQRKSSSFLNWQAAFIEDSYFLHLDRKKVFSVIIEQMLADQTILKCFVESAPSDVVDDVLTRYKVERPAA
ncbi:hypothetical protein [Luteimonas saliphila]|uniref:hypothetical protein n=1 Tax=Luteimonas saliphila TaxID=2804919 RepID=UPI00192D5FEF|nr:hypothetical protein [Luteimonas saliphila]